jgi:hypothetical protein
MHAGWLEHAWQRPLANQLRREGPEMPHWVYILSAVSSPLGLAAWRYAPRAFLMLVGGLTTDRQRSRQCAEMLRLAHKDAKDIPSYLTDLPGTVDPSPITAPPLQGKDATAFAIEGAQPPRSGVS